MGEAVADMILANATIYTADPAMPFAEAMAVRAGRVLHVGGYDSVKVVFNSLLLFFFFSFFHSYVNIEEDRVKIRIRRKRKRIRK